MTRILLCLLLAGCGSGGDEPATVCEKLTAEQCDAVMYAPTKANYGATND